MPTDTDDDVLDDVFSTETEERDEEEMPPLITHGDDSDEEDSDFETDDDDSDFKDVGLPTDADDDILDDFFSTETEESDDE